MKKPLATVLTVVALLASAYAQCSAELARRTGKAPTGFYVPNEVFTRNLVASTGTLGGMLVPTTPEGFINALRNKCQVLALGAQTMELAHPVTIPRQSGVGTVNWVGETVASTLTAVNFTNLTLTPYAVSANHQYSKQLLITGSESVDSIIRNDIIATIAEAIDLAALHGSGSGQPLGIAGTTGISTVAIGANGLSINNATLFPALVSLESMLAASNADFGKLSYLMRGTHRASCKKQVEFASTASRARLTGVEHHRRRSRGHHAGDNCRC
jgi:HK97 family phage major capsid protein